MKRKKLQTVKKPLSLKMIAMVLTIGLLLFACKKNDSTFIPPKNPDQQVTQLTLAEAAMINEAKSKLNILINDRKVAKRFGPNSQQITPSTNGAKRSESEIANSLFKNADVQFYNNIISKAINPSDYECATTAIDDYIQNSILTWDDNDFLFFNYFGGVVFDYAYVYANTNGGQTYGSKGQYTNSINRTFKDLLRFWNIPSDILMRDAHSNLYKDVNKVSSVLELYGYTEEDADYYAGLCKIVFGSDHFYKYHHPLLTFNAFAAPADDFFGTPKKIVMGDGILKAYDDLGFEDVAPQAILAHEYGHQVQFAKDVVFEFTPEGTRRTELMADAFAGYYLTHKQGAAMNMKRVQEFLEVFYLIGDCQFDNNNHHGTPNQRMRAAKFGYSVANDAKKKGKILKAEDFILLFDAEYAYITAPDA